MDRSRSKRGYHYDQDSPPSRSKPRFDRRGCGAGPNPNPGYHRRGPPGGSGGSDRLGGFLPSDAAPPPPLPPPAPHSSSAEAGGPALTTSFRILCPESKSYGFSASFIAKVRDNSGALVTVHSPFAGDPASQDLSSLKNMAGETGKKLTSIASNFISDLDRIL